MKLYISFIKVTLSVIVVCFINCGTISGYGDNLRKFPDNFKFGVATSSYQIEGAWNEADKGEGICDRVCHAKQSTTKNASSGDVACNSYRLYKRDVEMVDEIGVDFYRFSISWTRLLPSGFSNKISKFGLKYYNGLINALIAHNITPMVTLYHWDLPQKLQDLGGWTNPRIVEYFEDYARVVFTKFGDRVKNWVIINDPKFICYNGYGIGGDLAPNISFSGIADYLCNHYVLLAHARAWHLYDKEFRPRQHGRAGISFHTVWMEPESNSTRDLNLAELAMQFNIGWSAHPIFSINGDYPKVMREAVAAKSSEQGFPRSRLPEFTQDEKLLIRGAADFFGMNYYTSAIVRGNTEGQKGFPVPSFSDDFGYETYQPEKWPPSSSKWLRVYPRGLRKMLNWVKNQYSSPEVIITENGYSTGSGLVDYDRIRYIRQHLQETLIAVLEDKCNVTSYTVWSLMDNFEWPSGYRERFGLYEVDFNDEKRTRTPRISVQVYKNIITTKTVDPDFIPEVPKKSSSSSGTKKATFLIIVVCFIFLMP